MSEKIASHEHLEPTPLSRCELDVSIDYPSISEKSAIAGARLESMILDLEENPDNAGDSFADRKRELEVALDLIDTTETEDEELGPYGLLSKRAEVIKNGIKKDNKAGSATNIKQWESRLAAMELAMDVLFQVDDERANEIARKTRTVTDEELYQEHVDMVNSDLRNDHNSRVRENEKRRKLVEQKKLVAGINTRSA